MRDALVAGGVGLLAGGLLALVLLKKKASDIDRRAEGLAAAARRGTLSTSDRALSMQIQAAIASLEEEVQVTAMRLAEKTAKQELDRTYGLTQERMRNLEALSLRLGAG
jgi:pantothenate synthetase